jgi:hypothetical protein
MADSGVGRRHMIKASFFPNPIAERAPHSGAVEHHTVRSWLSFHRNRTDEIDLQHFKTARNVLCDCRPTCFTSRSFSASAAEMWNSSRPWAAVVVSTVVEPNVIDGNAEEVAGDEEALP